MKSDHTVQLQLHVKIDHAVQLQLHVKSATMHAVQFLATTVCEKPVQFLATTKCSWASQCRPGGREIGKQTEFLGQTQWCDYALLQLLYRSRRYRTFEDKGDCLTDFPSNMSHYTAVFYHSHGKGVLGIGKLRSLPRRFSDYTVDNEVLLYLWYLQT